MTTLIEIPPDLRDDISLPKLRGWTLRHRLVYAVGLVRVTLFSWFATAMWYGPGRYLRHRMERARALGQQLDMESIPSPFMTRRDYLRSPDDPELPSPNITKTRKSKKMAMEAFPSPDGVLRYARPPISGNRINGLGETAPRRPRKPFHHSNYSHPYGLLESFFHLTSSLDSMKWIFDVRRDNLLARGPIAPTRREVTDPADMAREIKAIARSCGAELVGVTTVRDDHVYEGREVPYRTAICVAMAMDREEMLHAPSVRSNAAVMKAYRDVGRVANQVAEAIRDMGWGACAITNLSGDAPVLLLPLAIEAGLGELGKHGSLITREFGSNLRLSTVLTDLPLELDVPIDLGVDAFCTSCRVCTTNCPPKAIFEVKQDVRGVEKWYVDFDRCIPYFVEQEGCGLCTQVCPWSEPGQGFNIFEKMLARAERAA